MLVCKKKGKKVCVDLPFEVVELGMKNWDGFLMGFFVGNGFSYVVVKKFMNANKKMLERVDILSNGQGSFFLKFYDKVVKREVIEKDIDYSRSPVHLEMLVLEPYPLSKLVKKSSFIGKTLWYSIRVLDL